MLKKLTFYIGAIISIYFHNNLQAQIIAIQVEPQTFYCPGLPKDTLNKVYIHGRVTRQGEPKTYLAKANVQIKNTDISISTDSLGYYWLDISEMSDITKNYVVQCSFVNHQSVEKIIDLKIQKTTVVNFELTLNGGISSHEATQVKPTKKKKKSRKHK
ncbi:MAG: carboxypeptidase-like regulatory domain-containing protein [Bacteroidia bacterium]|nr:carboxypeptidase-like regulatory domain-containing protein [Bacteroidia bacterium]